MINLSEIDCLLFDLDGTLINTTNLIVEGYYYTWERNFGYRPERTAVVQTMGLLLKEGMSSLVASGVSDNRIPPVEAMEMMAERLVEDYRVFNASYHDTLIEPFPGVVEMLGALKQYGYRIGVVTSKRRDGAKRGLGIFGLDRFIDCLIAADDTVEHKPHPAPVLKGIECLGSRPETAAYVGDSTHDMIAGRRAGVVTIAACWGPFVRSELEAINPDWLADSPLDITRSFQA